jgi:PAS domain S-box-containing protein
LRSNDGHIPALGKIEQWPQALQTTFGLVLTANSPRFIAWGDDLITLYNDSCAIFFGDENSIAFGKPLSHLWNDKWIQIKPALDQALKGIPAHNVDLIFSFHSESHKDLEVLQLTLLPIYEDKQVRGVYGEFSETTHVNVIQHDTEKLRENEKLLWQIADTIPQLAWMADETGAVNWYNKRWYEYTGTTPQELEGWGWQAVHHPNEVPKVVEAWTAAVANGTPLEMTFPMRGSDGNFRQFFCLAVPLKNSDGKIVRWFGTNTDVSTLYSTQAALLRTEELLEEGLLIGRMVVWEWDIHNQAIHYSENAKDVLGYDSPDPAVGWASIHPDDVKELKIAVDLAIAERSSFQKLTRRTRPDTGQALWVEIKGRVALNAQGEPEFIRGMMIDITDRVNAENELKNSSRRKDEFLAMLAHELRNPLAPISTSAQILKIPNLDDENIKFASDTIARQVKHMSDLIDDLMDVSRVTRGLVKLQSEAVDLKLAVASAIEQARPIIDARYHTLTTTISDSPIFVRGDATRLIQVISNVLNNAAKYTPEAGKILLTLDVNKAQAIVTISDNGIGILPSLLPHIFDLFTQAERTLDRSQGGLGLGLTLVKSITELHGGSVSAHSNGQGSGSTFSVSLPLLLELKNEPTGNDLVNATADNEPLVLMIVDDNLDAASSLAALMTVKGHTVITRHTAYSALEFPDKKSINIFILDIGLPDIDGYDLVRRLKANPQTADALFIALTGYGQPQDRAFSAAAGFDHHLLKPVNIDGILNLLAQYKPAKKVQLN